MARLRTRMSKIKELLRLKFDCHLPNRSISACLNIGCSTVSDVVTRFRGSQLAWPLPEDMTESQLEALLYTGHANLSIRVHRKHTVRQVSTTGKKWVFRNLGGDFHARGLITRRLSSSNPARPYICRFSIFRRFTWPSTTPLLQLLVMASHIAAASVSIPAATR